MCDGNEGERVREGGNPNVNGPEKNVGDVLHHPDH